MRGGKNTRGYTIVEVMLFLAISGFMFVIAATFISGKQSTAEFRQGMNSINTQVQQAINDVANGFYPLTTGNFVCSANSSGQPVFGAGSSDQGSNGGCVFLGKIMQFSVASKPTDYSVYSVAGRQAIGALNVDPSPPTTFVQAQPKLVTTPVDVTDQKVLEWGVQVTGMYKGAAAAANSIGAVGFFGSFNPSAQGSSQTVTAVAIPSSTLVMTEANMVNLINAALEPGKLDAAMVANPDPVILICFQSGTGRFGSLTIGGTNGQRLSTSIRIDNNAAAVGCI